ncbi:uncharacterized protein LOC110925711 isoform X1 [Helianthus annuus]|nr:uncharacterized protein LOC110925711 isoform X1 [Helianthus annuus]
MKSLIKSSKPTASFFLTMVLPEDTKAYEIMAELRVILVDANRAHLERGKAQVAGNKLTVGESLVQIQSCFENLNVQVQQRAENACLVILKLHQVDELLTRLPASERAKIQPCFDSLRAEAFIAIGKLAEDVTILADENQIRIHQLTAPLPASERAMIQPCFDILRAEAFIAIRKLAEDVTILADENQIRIHQLTATLKPSS